jgi:hypothetical protein
MKKGPMNDQIDDFTEEQPQATDELLASGGGSSPASGVTFQGSLGASLGIAAITDNPLDRRLGLGRARARSLRFETEAPIDDILLPTTDDGFVFVQAKTSLESASRLDSELGKTALEIVRNWRICSAGAGSRGWDRPLSAERDRFLIAVGPRSSGTIVQALGSALDLRREAGTRDTLNAVQKAALLNFRSLLKLAWAEIVMSDAADEEIDRLLELTFVLRFDFDGADFSLAAEILKSVLVDGGQAPAAVDVLARKCQNLMSRRAGLMDTGAIRRTIETSGLKLTAPPDFRADIDVFRAFSERMRVRLVPSETILLDGNDYPVTRQFTPAATLAVREGSLLLVGEPGAGKSGVLNQIGTLLENTGAAVLRLSVEALPMQGLNGLREGIGLAHPIREVLANWPGIESAFLLIDGLDASRDNDSEPAFRALIEETMGLPGERWKVLASIRSFDLQHGDKFRSLFAGSPPCAEFATKEFKKVRHIQVTAWSDEELDDLLARTPRLASALDACGKSLRGLALVPFNTQLLAELITDSVEPEALNTLRTQADLLDLYWKKRVYNHGQAAFGCLRRILKEMIEKRSLQVSSASADPCEPAAFERLLKDGVLIQPGGVRYLAFRHNILFDYAASQLYLDPAQGEELKRLFERGQGLGLLLAPALGYALQELWSSDAGRSAYWTTALQLIGDKSVDPIARSVAARSCCELPRTEEDMTGLIEAVRATPGAAIALHHIVGSLAIHFEDHPRLVALAPWVRLATETSTRDDLAAVLSFLLNILIPRGADDLAS